MDRTPRPLIVAVALGALLLGAGCSTAPPGATTASASSTAAAGGSAAPAGAASGDAVAWTNNVCGALTTFTKVASKPPQLDNSSVQASVQSLSTYLGQVTAALDSTITDLKGVGPSPAAGGDEAVAKLSAALTQYRTAFQKAKTNLDQSHPMDSESLQTALAPIQDIKNLPNPADGLQASPELESAALQAPNCRSFMTPPTTATTAPGGN